MVPSVTGPLPQLRRATSQFDSRGCNIASKPRAVSVSTRVLRVRSRPDSEASIRPASSNRTGRSPRGGDGSTPTLRDRGQGAVANSSSVSSPSSAPLGRLAPRRTPQKQRAKITIDARGARRRRSVRPRRQLMRTSAEMPRSPHLNRRARPSISLLLRTGGARPSRREDPRCVDAVGGAAGWPRRISSSVSRLDEAPRTGFGPAHALATARKPQDAAARSFAEPARTGNIPPDSGSVTHRS